MREPVTIDSAAPENQGLSYVDLKREGTAMVQRLAGAIWTDFNEHDPGVTTLEQLCYALTELSYRAEFSVADLLTHEVTGRIDPHRQALFVPRRIFPCNPVTIDDYRKLLVDRVPGVANVWLVPVKGRTGRDGEPSTPRSVRRHRDGLYDILVYAPETGDLGGEARAEVTGVARRVYGRHRNLCEDVRSVCLLEPRATTVHAEISIDDEMPPEEILAGLLFAVGNFLAPELERFSLKSQLEAAKPSDVIFEGPLLTHGFFAEEQLEPKAEAIAVQAVEDVMTRSAGVAGVREVRIRVADGAQVYRGGDSVPVGPRNLLQLVTRPREGHFSLRLFKNGVEVSPDPRRVLRLLRREWANYRRLWPLAPEYHEYFAFPRGRYRDVRQYYSIQNQYPRVYGIGDYGLPGDASAARRGQAKQLKGYLLVFDQLLANFFAQLARVRDLFSLQPDLEHTYFFQYLGESVPDVQPLLKKGPGLDSYRRGLPALVSSQDPVVERRNRFLDVLLALYGERLDSSSVVEDFRARAAGSGSGDCMMRAKLALLNQLVSATVRRGTGCDYLETEAQGARSDNVAGLVIKSRIQLGMDEVEPGPLSEALVGFGMFLVASGAEVSAGRLQRRHHGLIEGEFFRPRTEGSTVPAGEEHEHLPCRRVVTVELALAAGSLASFRIGVFPGEEQVSVVVRVAGAAPGEESWYLVGKYRDFDQAESCCMVWVAQMRELGRRFDQLYIVENILLRFGRSWRGDGVGKEEPGADFVYPFTVTAVLSTCAGLERDPGYRDFARQILRQNTPAHIALEVLFLGPREICAFEALYLAWERTLLGASGWRELVRASARLRLYLARAGKGEKSP